MSLTGYGAGAAPFRILYVCVHNVCRSVLAERYTRRDLTVRLGESAARFHASSAGTAATAGRPMHPYVRDILAARGAATDGFASRRLTPALITSADLVLTATAAERDRTISLVPRVLPQTFTIREFARLCENRAAYQPDASDVAAHARMVVAAAQQVRGRLPYVEPASYDIADPPASREAFERCAASVAVPVAAALAALCPVATAHRPFDLISSRPV